MNTTEALETPCKQLDGESPGTPTALAPAEPPPRTPKRGSVTGYHGNRNAMRHGLKASALPKGCGWIHRDMRGFRRAVEDAVVEVHGEVSIVHAAAINTACRAETHAQLAARWLRDQIDVLDANQRLSYSAAVVKASESRDKALATLCIDKRSLDPWSRLTDVLNVPSTPTQQEA